MLSSSLIGKARLNGLVNVRVWQIRDFASDRHRTTDDSPYGGGEGMLLKVDVLYRAWKAASGQDRKGENPSVRTIFLSPQGQCFNQRTARRFSSFSKLILVCGHYEGVDERFIELCVDEEISIGDYILMGGELPALVLAETVIRLLPGVVGNDRSLTEESLEKGMIKYPQYTRPRSFLGMEVPEVLLSGDHGQIQAWRDRMMRERTEKKRPDLVRKAP